MIIKRIMEFLELSIRLNKSYGIKFFTNEKGLIIIQYLIESVTLKIIIDCTTNTV